MGDGTTTATSSPPAEWPVPRLIAPLDSRQERPIASDERAHERAPSALAISPILQRGLHSPDEAGCSMASCCTAAPDVLQSPVLMATGSYA